MRKVFGTVILVSGVLSAAPQPQVRWADVYKSGPVQIQTDPSFGRGVDWGIVLFNNYKDIVTAEDGTVFVTNSREHTIHKFDPTGRKLLTFGKPGQGPGDLQNPGSPSFLNGKYLVVTEYALTHRISLFDLNGRFFKLLKTQRPVYDAVGLSGTKIAYFSIQFETGGKKSDHSPGLQTITATARIVLKDIETGAERVVLTRMIPSHHYMMNAGMSLSFGSETKLRVLIARAADGNLAVGITNSPLIEIFDLEGKLVRSFSLKFQARPASPAYIAGYKKAMINASRPQSSASAEERKILAEVESIDFSTMFDKTLPLYKDMITDADGNFIFFRWDDDPTKNSLAFAAYSPQGEFLADSRLDPRIFNIGIDYRFWKLNFAKVGLIGLASRLDDEDENPILFRADPILPVRK